MEENINYSKLTKREKKELKKKLKQERKLEKEKKYSNKIRNKKIFKWFLYIIIIVVFISFIIFVFSSEKQESYSKGEIHWHSRLKIFVCGNEIDTPAPEGEHHVGLPLLHTHKDKLIHIEGVIWKPEDISLGKYMGAIGMNFKDDELINKKNGDLCNEKSGKVKLFVNGIENYELTNYAIKDDEDYELRFE